MRNQKKQRVQVAVLFSLIVLIIIAAVALIMSDKIFEDKSLISAAINSRTTSKDNPDPLKTVLQTIDELDEESRNSHSADPGESSPSGESAPSNSAPSAATEPEGNSDPNGTQNSAQSTEENVSDQSSANNEEQSTKDPLTLPSAALPTEPMEPIDPDSLDYKYIALTFDDGPYDVVDEAFLDLLSQYDGKATFFFLGSRVPYYPETVKKIVEQGSEIGIHGYNHPDLTTLTADEIHAEIDLMNAEINNIVDYQPKLMRPPYGSYNDFVRETIGMPLILWNIDTLDWSSKDAYAVSEMLTDVPAGSVVLMHSLYESTLEGLQMSLPSLYEQGYRFVTVSELFRIHGIPLESHSAYSQSY